LLQASLTCSKSPVVCSPSLVLTPHPYPRKPDFRTYSLPRRSTSTSASVKHVSRLQLLVRTRVATRTNCASCVNFAVMSTLTLMSSPPVSHGIAARSPMDPDTAHTFSESSRNTLITTAIVGKSSQSCLVGRPVNTCLSPTSTHHRPLPEHKSTRHPNLVHVGHQLTPPQAVLSCSLFSCMSSTGDEKALHMPRSYTYLQEDQAHHNSHQHR
jgi:hypothetical protein